MNKVHFAIIAGVIIMDKHQNSHSSVNTINHKRQWDTSFDNNIKISDIIRIKHELSYHDSLVVLFKPKKRMFPYP
jgi:hypothetical protein